MSAERNLGREIKKRAGRIGATALIIGAPAAGMIFDHFSGQTPDVSAADPVKNCVERVDVTNNSNRGLDVLLIDGSTGARLDRERIEVREIVRLEGTGVSTNTSDGQPAWRSFLEAEGKRFSVEALCKQIATFEFRIRTGTTPLAADRTPTGLARADSRAEAAGGNANANANTNVNQNIINLNVPGAGAVEGTPTPSATQKPTETSTPTSTKTATPTGTVSPTKSPEAGTTSTTKSGEKPWVDLIDGGGWAKVEVRYWWFLPGAILAAGLIGLARRGGRVEIVERTTTTTPPPTPPVGGEGQPQPVQPTPPTGGAPQAAAAQPERRRILGIIPRPRGLLRRAEEKSPKERVEELEKEKEELKGKLAEAENKATNAATFASNVESERKALFEQKKEVEGRVGKAEERAKQLEEERVQREREEKERKEAANKRRRDRRKELREKREREQQERGAQPAAPVSETTPSA